MSKQILLLKKGDFKTGFLSKKTAGEFHFYEDRIVFNTHGWSRLFNNAPITIEKSSMLRYTEGLSVIGYSIKLETKSGNYHLRFMRDKMAVLNILNGYIGQ
jgi:hypothetical protein